MPRTTVIPPLACDLSGLLIPETGLDVADFAGIAPRLETVRRQVLADARSNPQAGFLDLPDRLLAEYKAGRHRSAVGRIMKRAERLAERVDRVVLLAAGGLSLGPRAVVEACCHPFHNELTRGERGGHPRLYFAGQDFDNDRTQGLLDLLAAGRPARDLADRWAIIAVSRTGRKLETAVAVRQFLAALRESCSGDDSLVAELFLPIAGLECRLRDVGQALGCREIFDLPENVDGRFVMFSAAVLLPAALLGLDVVKLLEGAAAMSEQFREQAADEFFGPLTPGNMALKFAAASHLLETRRGSRVRVLSTWHPGLEAAGLWHEQLLSESLAEHSQAARPMTAVQPRDQTTRGGERRPGVSAGDGWTINLIVDQAKRDRLSVGHAGDAESNADRLDPIAGKTLTDLTKTAIAGQGTDDAWRRRPAADLHLPRLDEASLGQWFQLLMLVAAVEGRLNGVDPYRSAGVPGYKQALRALLKNND